MCCKDVGKGKDPLMVGDGMTVFEPVYRLFVSVLDLHDERVSAC